MVFLGILLWGGVGGDGFGFIFVLCVLGLYNFCFYG